MRRLLVTAALALALAGPAGAASAPWRTLTVTRHAGAVAATMTIERQSQSGGFYEYRRLRLVVRVAGTTIVDRSLCGNERCSAGSQHSLALQNVAGGPLDEAVLSIFTGGAHCCYETLIAFVDGPHRGRLLDRNWGDPGYAGKRHDGIYEFVTADDRFAYAFTAFAASGLPLQVFAIDPAGQLKDITWTRLDLVRADATQWWQTYVRYRGKKDWDVRGLVAAWCADEVRLGEAAACRAELASAVRKQYLDGPSIWPEGTKFVALLDRSLARWGYLS